MTRHATRINQQPPEKNQNQHENTKKQFWTPAGLTAAPCICWRFCTLVICLLPVHLPTPGKHWKHQSNFRANSGRPCFYWRCEHRQTSIRHKNEQNILPKNQRGEQMIQSVENFSEKTTILYDWTDRTIKSWPLFLWLNCLFHLNNPIPTLSVRLTALLLKIGFWHRPCNNWSQIFFI